MSTSTRIPSERIAELTREPIAITPYDPAWPARYAAEEARLKAALPGDLCTCIAHIGSTAVPGLSAKPVIDIQVEVTDLGRVRIEVVPVMKQLGYEFIWRPSMGERAPWYAWFIARDGAGNRMVHVHMVEPDHATADRLLFRDYLRARPEAAAAYESLKRALAQEFPNDRAAYTAHKSAFIQDALREARGTATPPEA